MAGPNRVNEAAVPRRSGINRGGAPSHDSRIDGLASCCRASSPFFVASELGTDAMAACSPSRIHVRRAIRRLPRSRLHSFLCSGAITHHSSAAGSFLPTSSSPLERNGGNEQSSPLIPRNPQIPPLNFFCSSQSRVFR
jgi:hypothetical protein